MSKFLKHFLEQKRVVTHSGYMFQLVMARILSHLHFFACVKTFGYLKSFCLYVFYLFSFFPEKFGATDNLLVRNPQIKTTNP